jgi:hypothetical protein
MGLAIQASLSACPVLSRPVHGQIHVSGSFFLFSTEANESSTQLVLKKTIQTMRCLICPDFGHCGARKIRAYVFVTQKSIFQPIVYPKHLSNIVGTLINLSMASKNRPKNQNQSESKDQPKLRSVFSLTLKVKKTT